MVSNALPMAANSASRLTVSLLSPLRSDWPSCARAAATSAGFSVPPYSFSTFLPAVYWIMVDTRLPMSLAVTVPFDPDI